MSSEAPLFARNQNMTLKHYQSFVNPAETNMERTRLNYQYYRSHGGSSFSSNFNARRAYLNDKYMMRQINQRSFDEFVPSGMMPHDMRTKLPNIPGVTEKTLNDALKSGDDLHEHKGLRTTKSSLNKMHQIGQQGEKQLSPIVVRPQNLNHLRDSSNYAMRPGQHMYLSPQMSPLNSDMKSQMKKSHVKSWN